MRGTEHRHSRNRRQIEPNPPGMLCRAGHLCWVEPHSCGLDPDRLQRIYARPSKHVVASLPGDRTSAGHNLPVDAFMSGELARIGNLRQSPS